MDVLPGPGSLVFDGFEAPPKGGGQVPGRGNFPGREVWFLMVLKLLGASARAFHIGSWRAHCVPMQK